MLSPSQTQKQQRIECLLSDGLSVETIAMMTGTSVRYVNHFVKSKNNPPLKPYTIHAAGRTWRTIASSKAEAKQIVNAFLNLSPCTTNRIA